MFSSPGKLLTQIWDGGQGNGNPDLEEEVHFCEDNRFSSGDEASFDYKVERNDILPSMKNSRRWKKTSDEILTKVNLPAATLATTTLSVNTEVQQETCNPPTVFERFVRGTTKNVSTINDKLRGFSQDKAGHFIFAKAEKTPLLQCSTRIVGKSGKNPDR